MNNEPNPLSPEPSDQEFDEALRRLQDDASEFEPLFEEMKQSTLINERLAMDALHIAGLPMELLESAQQSLGVNAPLEETFELLLAAKLAAELEDDPAIGRALDATMQLSLIAQRIASNKSLYDMFDPISAAEVRREEQLAIINEKPCLLMTEKGCFVPSIYYMKMAQGSR